MDNDQPHDSLFKYLIIGNTSCGKTCILHRFLKGEWVEFGSEIIEIEDKNRDPKKVKLQIWDTAGQERFQSVASTYYRGALGALVVYDCTNYDTFQSVQQWIQVVRDKSTPEIQITVCGNKADLDDQKVVSVNDAERFCEENKVNFMETSAKTGQGIKEAFMQVAQNIQTAIDKGLIDTSAYEQNKTVFRKKEFKLAPRQQEEEKKKKGCCG